MNFDNIASNIVSWNGELFYLFIHKKQVKALRELCFRNCMDLPWVNHLHVLFFFLDTNGDDYLDTGELEALFVKEVSVI